MHKKDQQVAVFIDAENIPAHFAAQIFEHAGRIGNIVERRVYGDFSTDHLKAWREAAPRHALDLHQIVKGAAGKNGADIALVIDCVELLYRTDMEIFVLVTSDSDFTQLAMRLRQRGRRAVGIGTSVVSRKLHSAVDDFVELPSPPATAPKKAEPKTTAGQTKGMEGLPALFQSALGHLKLGRDDWVKLNLLGAAMRATSPGFRPSDYGCAQLGKLLDKSGAFEKRTRTGQHPEVQLKPLKSVVAVDLTPERAA